jgi:hypothetical protein
MVSRGALAMPALARLRAHDWRSLMAARTTGGR